MHTLLYNENKINISNILTSLFKPVYMDTYLQYITRKVNTVTELSELLSYVRKRFVNG